MKILSFSTLLLIAYHAMVINAQPGKVQANGIMIAYESFGSKDNEAIVMIQGTGATLLQYEIC